MYMRCGLVGWNNVALELHSGLLATVRGLSHRKDPGTLPRNFGPWSDDEDNTFAADWTVSFFQGAVVQKIEVVGRAVPQVPQGGALDVENDLEPVHLRHGVLQRVQQSDRSHALDSVHRKGVWSPVIWKWMMKTLLKTFEAIPSCLIAINSRNEVVEGEGQPEVTALCIHKGIYSKRPDVKAVMHTHMPYATALTCLKDPQLLMIHQNSTQFYQRIAYDTGFSGLGDTFTEGKRLADVLGKKEVLFMGNHGVMTVATSVDVAFNSMYYLERAAMFQVLAYSTKRSLKELDENTARLTSEGIMKGLHEQAKSHLDTVMRRYPELSSKQH